MVHQLVDCVLVGAHAAAYEGTRTRGNVVATLKSPIACYAVLHVHSDLFIDKFHDFHFEFSLGRIHFAHDYAPLGSNALVSRKLKVDEVVTRVDRVIAGVVLGTNDFDFWFGQNNIDQDPWVQFFEILAHICLSPHDFDLLFGQCAQVVEVLAFMDLTVDDAAIHKYVAHVEDNVAQIL